MTDIKRLVVVLVRSRPARGPLSSCLLISIDSVVSVFILAGVPELLSIIVVIGRLVHFVVVSVVLALLIERVGLFSVAVGIGLVAASVLRLYLLVRQVINDAGLLVFGHNLAVVFGRVIINNV